MKLIHFIKKRRWIIAVMAGIILLVMIFFGAQIALLFNLLIGKDILVKLTVNQESFSLKHGEEAEVSFQTSVTTNPFCQALCSAKFENLQDNKVIDEKKLEIRPGLNVNTAYKIKAEEITRGLGVYRYTIKCHSLSTLLCRTGETPYTKNIIVTVSYDLNEEDKRRQQEIKNKLDSSLQQLEFFYAEMGLWQKAAMELEPVLDLSDFSSELYLLNLKLNVTTQFLEEMQKPWQNYDFLKLETEMKDLELELLQKEMKEFNLSLMNKVGEYEQLREELLNLGKKIQLRENLVLINSSRFKELNSEINSYNEIVKLFGQKESFEDKLDRTQAAVEYHNQLLKVTEEELQKGTLSRQFTNDIFRDLLCQFSGRCLPHPPPSERIVETNKNPNHPKEWGIFNVSDTPSDNGELMQNNPATASSGVSETNDEELVSQLNLTCGEISDTWKVYESIKDNFNDDYLKENYTVTDEFKANLSNMMENKRQEIIDSYLVEFPEPENLTLVELALQILTTEEKREVAEYPQYNLTPVLVFALSSYLPKECNIMTNFSEIVLLEVPEVAEPNLGLVKLSFNFSEPPLRCCVFGECQECCMDSDCQNDPKTYPVVFLHGHAISKDISAEYSLEGFEQIQEKLEKEGYLNAGSITLYTSKENPTGEWGLLGVPVSLKASYYYDLFEELGNYQLVQAKGENIDTYAVRLKDLVETIKFKTGKPKVNLVAFSMGGLVSRRYIQLFGSENVNMLILIGTPNKGIAGNIADYCPYVGEERECQDMDANSVFMKKLNFGKLPDIPIYNIVGTGCNMGGDDGDGAVLEESSLLEGANNFIIKGTCPSTVEPLHLKLRDINLYPEVYEIILGALEGKINSS